MGRELRSRAENLFTRLQMALRIVFGLTYNPSKSRDVIFSAEKAPAWHILAKRRAFTQKCQKEYFSELSLPGVEIVPTSCTSILCTTRASHLPYNAKNQNKYLNLVFYKLSYIIFY